MRHGRFYWVVGLLLAGAGSFADAGQLLDRLRVNHSAMVASERDFHQRQQRGSLNRVETSDYAAYVARLHRLVAEDCAALVEAGLPAPLELGCPLQPQAFLVPAEIDQAREQTAAEQLAALDAELLGGLGEFDEMLLREQERVRAQTPMADPADAASASGAAGAAGGGAGDAAGGEAIGADGSEQSDDGSGMASAGSSQTGSTRGQGMGPGSPRQGGGGRPPPDIPDGSDDDVVARQLREAAEKERSPALKEKLWEEYRKYKAGTR